MPQYRLGNPNISSISFNGIEHTVTDGLLHIEDQHNSIALQKHVKDHLGGEVHDDATAQAEKQNLADDDERQVLLAQLDGVHGKPFDRRKTTPQLRRAMADYHEAQKHRPGAIAATPVKTGAPDETG